MKKLILLSILVLSLSCSNDDDAIQTPTERCGTVFNKPGNTGQGCSNTTSVIRFQIGVSFNGSGESLCVSEETFNSLSIGDTYCVPL